MAAQTWPTATAAVRVNLLKLSFLKQHAQVLCDKVILNNNCCTALHLCASGIFALFAASFDLCIAFNVMLKDYQIIKS